MKTWLKNMWRKILKKKMFYTTELLKPDPVEKIPVPAQKLPDNHSNPITPEILLAAKQKLLSLVDEWVEKAHPIYVKLNHTWDGIINPEYLPSKEQLRNRAIQLINELDTSNDCFTSLVTGGIDIQVIRHKDDTCVYLNYVGAHMSRSLEE